jgi:ribonuclease HI
MTKNIEKKFALTVFSDGACKGNPGPGGWGTIVERDGTYSEYGGAESPTTNNRMEMTAAIEGIKRANPGEHIRVVTDSRYLIDGATKWIWGWKKKGWKKSDGGEVLNLDLWQEIDRRQASVKGTWEHVAGHSGHPENERCDTIASDYGHGDPVELREGDGAWIFEATPRPVSRPKKSSSSTMGAKGAKSAKAKKTATPPPPANDEKYAAPLYLSLVGGDIQEHTTWAACETRIKGVRGSRCKKVKTKGEHIAAIASWSDLA